MRKKKEKEFLFLLLPLFCSLNRMIFLLFLPPSLSFSSWLNYIFLLLNQTQTFSLFSLLLLSVVNWGIATMPFSTNKATKVKNEFRIDLSFFLFFASSPLYSLQFLIYLFLSKEMFSLVTFSGFYFFFSTRRERERERERERTNSEVLQLTTQLSLGDRYDSRHS